MKPLVAVLVALAVGAQAQTPEIDALRARAAQGDAEAQVNLGVRYDTGRGVPQDAAEAMRWYRLAADQGYALGQYNLGVRYATGEGVPQDYTEAVRWYRLAAGQGHAQAQYHLGGMYFGGRSVPQDDAEALRWYRLAAEQGNASAQYSLGAMCVAGRGILQDNVAAYMWFNLAASGLTGGLRDKAVQGRGLAETRLTGSQRAEAQRLASEWDAAPPREPHCTPPPACQR